MSRKMDEQFEKAMGQRLRSAFGSIGADDELVQKINVQSLHKKGLNIKLRPWLTVAAAIFFVILPLSFHLVKTRSVIANNAGLVEIHLENHEGNREFFTDSDPVKMAEFFKEKLGFSPVGLRTSNGVALRGCCTAHFRGKIVGSYGVETPDGFVSIVVVDETPGSIGMTAIAEKSGYWRASYSNCKMVAVRRNGYTYCAVGLVPEQSLEELLGRLMP